MGRERITLSPAVRRRLYIGVTILRAGRALREASQLLDDPEIEGNDGFGKDSVRLMELAEEALQISVRVRGEDG